MKITRLLVCGLAVLSLSAHSYAASIHATKANTHVHKQTVKATQTKRDKKVNLNSADAKAIAGSIKGIGLRRAAAIVAYRKQHGKFTSLERLAKVRGISARFIKKNHTQLEKVFVVG